MAELNSLVNLDDENAQRIWLEQLRVAVSTRWDDLRFPASTARLVPASRYSADTTNCGIIFDGGATPARYPDEALCHVVQLPHSWNEGTTIRPHMHWIQTDPTPPNWLLRYRFYNNGSAVTAFTNVIPATTEVFTYTSGSMLQISAFPNISMTDYKISCLGDVIIYRDYANASGLFAGAESGAPDVLYKEFDIHYEKDSWGSRDEFVK